MRKYLLHVLIISVVFLLILPILHAEGKRGVVVLSEWTCSAKNFAEQNKYPFTIEEVMELSSVMEKSNFIKESGYVGNRQRFFDDMDDANKILFEKLKGKRIVWKDNSRYYPVRITCNFGKFDWKVNDIKGTEKTT